MLTSLPRRLWNRLPERVRAPVLGVKYGAPAERQWLREAMNRDLARELDSAARNSDAVEVSGTLRGGLPWKSYTSLSYPDFDLCTSEPPDTFDVVICEQVLEHVPDPARAASTLRALCRPDAVLFVSVPLLVRVHGSPGDYWRFTPDGLLVLLERAGFEVEWIRTWGNRRAVKGNLGHWRAFRPWHSLRNDPACPLVVWAMARSVSR